MQSINVQFFGLLVVAVLFVWFFKRIGLPPILAYLATGVLAGSHGIGWMAHTHEIDFVAELGIVFLLFSLGLEFSISRLMAMRNIVFGLGSLQVVVTSLILIVVLYCLNFSLLTSFAISIIMALSSTAVVVKLLKETGELNQRRGQLAVGVLLFQDIAVVPLLIILPLLASSDSQSISWALAFALTKGAFVCLLLWAIGKWILPKVFNEIALVRTDELFVLTTLLVALFAALLTYMFGLSMALGAFLAGMMLGESHYRHQLEADIRPFRDILMGLFFVTVGMQLDLLYVFSNGLFIIGALLGLLILKITVVAISAQLMGERRQDALACAIMLWQMGEFGFVLIALSGQQQLLTSDQTSFLIALGVLSMAFTPFLIDKTPLILKRLGVLKRASMGWENEPKSSALYSNHVVICGFSRVGQTIARFLKPEAIEYVAIESNPILVQEGKAAGEPVIFGHVKQKDILKCAGVERARLVIITFTEFEQTQIVIDAIKQIAPEVKILIRTRDDSQLEKLKELGVTEVVPETLEASLMLVSHVLSMSGVPMSRIVRRVSKERRNRYKFLQSFFSGEHIDSDENNSDRLEYLHVIALPDKAFAVNKSISELNLTKRRVFIKALRRQDREIDAPSDQTLLLANDILVLQGKPRRVERVEHYLLDGIE
ncbi:monovalent cation:proton antiporter-2 (CPA2) family protein [Pseudoalteromonas sp. B131b]|uniref:monovalent cation:proton antiporter-2 (CPA2) family protein n=1 Tax=unclassified Pseudoalteromonas TaxID=194690 RepID=UPI00023164FE|nr:MULTISPECIES: monovalent cation:proton antiporter-2 (CPA2) family protein [unclassified Pseudoalteromonas]ATG77012.1 potassium transporter [Pseudoalteromonas sp. 1_2015MBL_MicDiv]GAA77949.1 glutathione-regulated potassium-efflux system protein kefB [Pseudoalteromonas sp. BSi20495]